ncbi:tetrahydroberberine oxidase-like [Populus nigra]|uniref:tetrahydroberberine oxidase-like n=1 Tax=Populus nigra TaxID=3691 RepID=UPI002B27213A|nr:tetrahydroberberine oxidase-like [Populus nigra]
MIEMISLSSSMLPLLFVLLFSFSWVTSAHTHVDFIECFSLYLEDSTDISKVIYTQNDSSYPSVLHFAIRNLRFNSTTLKPLVIVTPTNVSHIQAAIRCSQKNNLQFRIRSGGHDFEGLSYMSVLPFVILDLINFRSVTIDVTNKTAWVQAGATVGELYYHIAKKGRTLAFPAGICPTMGVGGHLSGGGYGALLRKYGLAADNVIDAELIDANGRVLDRKSMGEDLFWALRGGGGNSFGVVIAWKIKLVEVPPTLTVFNVLRTLEQNATQLIHRWQYIANKLHEDLMITTYIRRVNSSQGNPTIQATFAGFFLGGVDKLLQLMNESFPELGLAKDDCLETSWIEAIILNRFPGNTSLELLLDRTPRFVTNYKAKSDYVKEPMPEIALEGIFERFLEEDIETPRLLLVPYGGKMDQISESSSPFPHRAGNIYKIEHQVSWSEEGKEASKRHVDWIRRLYSYMTPYVSKNPREAYINYRDLDIGMNNLAGNTSFKQASIWGRKYFKNNFDKLVSVKTAVDPGNFFRNEQSIPPLSSW